MKVLHPDAWSDSFCHERTLESLRSAHVLPQSDNIPGFTSRSTLVS